MIDIKCNNIFKISLYLLLSFFWIISLSGTDAYYSVYILIVTIGMVAAYDNIFISHNILAWDKNSIVLIIYSSLFSVAVALANYHLFLAAYPGILTNDSISQMQQLLSNSNYSNHAPFYHTMLIKGCVSIGLCHCGY